MCYGMCMVTNLDPEGTTRLITLSAGNRNTALVNVAR